MGINLTNTAITKDQLEEIQLELYYNSKAFSEGIVEINDGFKSGADVYESKVSVEMKAYSSGAVTEDGSIDLDVNRTPVPLVKFMYSDVIKDEQLRGTRFDETMMPGAANVVSDEFDKKVLSFITPAIGQNVDSRLFNGATAATKAAIAALTPGAGQGSISASAQALVAAMDTTLFDSFPVRILYNNSQAKAVPGAGLGDYKKVLSPAAVTVSTIADEYAKIYAAADDKVINDTVNLPFIYAPYSDRQTIKLANNAKGAAQQINFLVEGTGASEKIYYNGVEIIFVPLVGFRILTSKKYLKLLVDLSSDLSSLRVDMMANGSDDRFIKNVQSLNTWVTNQKYITLYGG